MYDITDDKLRTKFAKELMRYLYRTQFSVFEGTITKNELIYIEDLAFKYSNDDDKVTIYQFLDVKRYGDVEYITNYDLIF
jgi:CRISPR-associated endonuclease Cas2